MGPHGKNSKGATPIDPLDNLRKHHNKVASNQREAKIKRAENRKPAPAPTPRETGPNVAKAEGPKPSVRVDRRLGSTPQGPDRPTPGPDRNNARLGESQGPNKPTQTPARPGPAGGGKTSVSGSARTAQEAVEQFYKKYGSEGLREMAGAAVKKGGPTVLKGLLVGTGIGAALMTAFQFLSGTPTAVNDTMEGHDADALLAGGVKNNDAGGADYIPPSSGSEAGLQDELPPLPPPQSTDFQMRPRVPMGAPSPGSPGMSSPDGSAGPPMPPQAPQMPPQAMQQRGAPPGAMNVPNTPSGSEMPPGAPQMQRGAPPGAQQVPMTREDSMQPGMAPGIPPSQPPGPQGMGQGGGMGGNLDALDFKQAFAQARKTLGPNGIFEWRGRKFTTKLKEEVNGQRR